MFTKEDYLNYFDQLADIYRDSISIYTDLLNDLQDKAIRNKLLMAASENMEAFRFIREEKKKFI
ncbi:MAG: hypothetical protein K9L87_05455 [Candidatus Omnitrophica bacterium]|jgi:hypothetical protein|nr:hypothetical protein [Candidatus Omnitrophota bacterium]MCF7877329.1 hypothetical protein [Candidatus Omnitrophota bacterium]MCF7891799.1 hypothetical protein [Candidatus Omnitrophota bacterium]MCF7898176.1 hypothetical protein [Candidatus Omnitrophota bacterium]MCF7909162.1 hypothetical protein [Candidatus Omnitrophota bacterium]